MTVKELKELLETCHDDDIVIICKDGEGNSYSPLSEIGEGSYEADSTWSGEVGLRELTDEDIEQGYTEEDLLENGVNAIVLYTVHSVMNMILMILQRGLSRLKQVSFIK